MSNTGKEEIDRLEAGELEVKKAFEETTSRNVKACVAHANETRRLLRDIEKKIQDLDNLIRSKDAEIENLKSQISKIQQKLYSGGS